MVVSDEMHIDRVKRSRRSGGIGGVILIFGKIAE